MRHYSRKQICEAISYWKKILNEAEEENEQPTLADMANEYIETLKKAIKSLDDEEAEDREANEALVTAFVQFMDANAPREEGQEDGDEAAAEETPEEVDEAESDLTTKDGTIGNVMMAHRDEILNMPSSQDAKEFMEQLFADSGINTPKSREILMNLDQMTQKFQNPRVNYERTAVYLNDVIMKAQGMGMTRRGRGSRW